MEIENEMGCYRKKRGQQVERTLYFLDAPWRESHSLRGRTFFLVSVEGCPNHRTSKSSNIHETAVGEFSEAADNLTNLELLFTERQEENFHIK